MTDDVRVLATARRRAQDRRTVEAIARLYRKHDAGPPPLFDDVPAAPRGADQLARYVELMGRPPLHAEKDRITLRQKVRRP